ncbi:mannosyl-oligosaccharide 1,2-alpha-mannosidase precursor [Phyllosticta citrichinensis]|uniref:alpha-1,2-Mannosidase n=1 Tax=Phyllosticta citrichinensis TaxID=1130410 RepID=A0ABR1XNQ1_9PEZI
MRSTTLFTLTASSVSFAVGLSGHDFRQLIPREAQLKADDPLPGPRRGSFDPVPPEQTEEEKSRAGEIKDMFKTAWDGYFKYAFPRDELRPANNSFLNEYNGWALTLVDALDTAALMGFDDLVSTSLDYIPSINYSRDSTDKVCSLFETNIRHLGGLLAAHELFTGPLANLATNKSEQVAALLTQAQAVADTLKFGFDTPTGIPQNNLYINNRSTDNSTDNNIAQVGTLVLEWTRLSDKLGKDEYGKLAQKGEQYILKPQPSSGEPYPGLVGIEINITTGRFTTGLGGWVGGVDSFYEYLMKMWIYDQDRFSFYKDRWVTAVESSIKYLESHPSSRPDLTFLALHNETRIVGYSQHLACFDGGNWILGGLALKEPRYVDFGLRLVDGCAAIYNETETGLGPSIFRWDPVGTPPEATKVPANQTSFYRRAGFWIVQPEYGLGPEVVESFYHAWRATGDKKYQELIWGAFQSIREFTKVGSGYSIIEDVNGKVGSGYGNYQPSFFLAETLKYMWLAFTPQSPVHVSGVEGPENQQWVFNTEAHPVQVFKPRDGGRRPKRDVLEG